ncbi:hypothetical protein VUR80DRAFT_3104 [Thermomyces stellatus]
MQPLMRQHPLGSRGRLCVEVCWRPELTRDGPPLPPTGHILPSPLDNGVGPPRYQNWRKDRRHAASHLADEARVSVNCFSECAVARSGASVLLRRYSGRVSHAATLYEVGSRRGPRNQARHPGRVLATLPAWKSLQVKKQREVPYTIFMLHGKRDEDPHGSPLSSVNCCGGVVPGFWYVVPRRGHA